MSDTITVPRVVVEQALSTLTGWGNYDKWVWHESALSTAKKNTAEMITALRAALEKPQVEQEPVAWAEEIVEYLHAHYDTEMIKELDSGDALIRLDDAIAAVEEVEQRYTHPQNLNCKSTQARLATLWGYEKPQPPRQPLTDEQVTQICALLWSGGWRKKAMQDFARAIERAHGIGE